MAGRSKPLERLKIIMMMVMIVVMVTMVVMVIVMIMVVMMMVVMIIMMLAGTTEHIQIALSESVVKLYMLSCEGVSAV